MHADGAGAEIVIGVCTGKKPATSMYGKVSQQDALIRRRIPTTYYVGAVNHPGFAMMGRNKMLVRDDVISAIIQWYR